jgi:inner membrane protein
MDNVTHSLVGLAASKAGLDRLSPAATAVCVLAANAPDVDIVTLTEGRWTYLQDHRGITHSILGTFILALVIPSLFCLGELAIAHFRNKPPRLRFRGLLLAAMVAGATHPLMDWTNSYGLRPLLPWSSRWYYGDLTFIVDPWLWLLIGTCAFLASAARKWHAAAWVLLALVLSAAILLAPRSGSGPAWVAFKVIWFCVLIAAALLRRAQSVKRKDNRFAIAGLALMVAYWGGLALAHYAALNHAQELATHEAAARGEAISRVVAMPTLADPSRWQCLAETDRATYRFEVFIGRGRMSEPAQGLMRYEKPEGDALRIVEVASRDPRTRIFLGFARFPVVRVQQTGDGAPALVQFADLRFTEPGSSSRGVFALEIPVDTPVRAPQ